MRTTQWLLPVGLSLAVIGGCSSSRFGLAKNDAPAKKPKDADVVEYGNPWKKPKKEEPVEPKELPPELAKLKEKRQATKDQPSDVTPWLKNAAVAESKGELGAAKELYKKILDKDPNNSEAHHRLAVIADQQQDPQTADVHYQTALKLNRKDADLLSDMGYSLYLRGKYDESEMRLKEALEANAYHRGAHSNLGLVYGKQGKYDQALAAFRQAGTESDAQRNMAQLFPNGRPNGNNAAAPGANLAGNTSRVAPAMPSDVDQKLTGASWQDVQQRMQEQRDAAVRARQNQTGQEFRPEFRDLEQPPSMVNRNAAAPNGAGNPTPPNNSNPAWPPVALTPPPTFNGANNNPAMMPQGFAANAAPAATNVAKPAESNPFWTGNLGNTMPSTNPAGTPPSGFAQNMSPPANFGANPPGMMPNPARSAMSNGDPSTAWMGNDFAGMPPAGNAFDANDSPVQPAGFQDFAAAPGNFAGTPGAMNDASRMAAQMAMATGPGGLLPVVTPGRGAASAPGNNMNRAQWAYEETNGPVNRNVENAVYLRQPGADRATPAGNAVNSQPAPSITPPSPWGDFQSPGPSAINWNDSPSNTGVNPPQWNPNGNAPPTSPNGSIPAWPGNANTGAAAGPNGSNLDTYRWNDFSNGNAARPNNAVNSGGAMTIPDWPNAPSRP